MKQATVIFSSKWESEQTDCRECSICKDIIVSDMRRLIIIARGEPKVNVTQSDDPRAINVDIDISQRKTKTDIVVCLSCYEIIETK